MMELLVRLEATGLGTWVREAPTLWAYPTVLFLHTVGLGFLVGINVAVDLRFLGVGEGLPLPALRRLFPVMWAGFWINAVSGAALILADASTKLTNPVFYVKMLLVAAGLLLMIAKGRLLTATVLLTPDTRTVRLKPDTTYAGDRTRLLAICSLAVWIAATTAGRLMGYLGPKSGLE
jgi:hypothetical protein